MIFNFRAFGHPNITSIHKTTLEFTKDKEFSLKGSCIIGVNSDFEFLKLRKFIKKLNNGKIKITIELKNKEITEEINAEVHPKFNSENDIVIRKSEFINRRTFAIKADKSSIDLNRVFVDYLRNSEQEIEVTIEDEKLIKVHNRKGDKFKDIKPQIDRIAQYLIDEGFVRDLIPMVKVIMY